MFRLCVKSMLLVSAILSSSLSFSAPLKENELSNLEINNALQEAPINIFLDTANLLGSKQDDILYSKVEDINKLNNGKYFLSVLIDEPITGYFSPESKKAWGFSNRPSNLILIYLRADTKQVNILLGTNIQKEIPGEKIKLLKLKYKEVTAKSGTAAGLNHLINEIDKNMKSLS